MASIPTQLLKLSSSYVKREERRSRDNRRMVPLEHESLISINSVRCKQHNKLNLKPCNAVAAQIP